MIFAFCSADNLGHTQKTGVDVLITSMMLNSNYLYSTHCVHMGYAMQRDQTKQNPIKTERQIYPGGKVIWDGKVLVQST